MASDDLDHELALISNPPPDFDFLQTTTKIESNDDTSLLSDSTPLSSSGLPSRNFRSKKRNRVMQSCVACHAQKRKCDRKRPCTRCTEHGIAGQCVYQLEDPALRDGPEQDELLRLRRRVRELEQTVRVLMQKPLSRRAAAALEAETDAILGTTSTRKRKVDFKDRDSADDRATKLLRVNTAPDGNSIPQWVSLHDASFPSPIDSAFSPYATTPSDSYGHSYGHHHHHHHMYSMDFTPPGDVPTPPYSTFPTPSSDAGSPFKIPDPPARRFSDGTTLANMLSHASMAVTPDSMSAAGASPLTPASMSSSGVVFAPITGAANPGECGCGVNPIGNEVLTELASQLDAAHAVLSSLPDHQVGGPCVTILGIASLIDAIQTATGANQSTAVSAPPLQTPQTPQPPPPPSGPLPMPITAPSNAPPPPPPSSVVSSYMTPASTTHMSPISHLSPAVSEPGPSPHSSIATPPNYGLYQTHQPPQNFPSSFYHADVPTVVGFNSLSSWAAYGGSTSFMNANGSSGNIVTPSSLSNFDGKGHHGGMPVGHYPSSHHPHQHLQRMNSQPHIGTPENIMIYNPSQQ